MTKKEFEIAEKKMHNLLAIATQKGGFEKLTKKESSELDKYTQLVKDFEDIHYSVPMPETLQGLLELKMYERKIRQKEMAKMLHVTDTKFSEIMHNKRKPNISFLKALNEILGIDGNLLLKIA